MTKKVVRTLVAIFLVLFWFIRMFQTEVAVTVEDEKPFACDEWLETDSISLMRKHQRSWLEYTWNDNFCTQYSTSYEWVQQASNERTKLKLRNWKTDDDFWGAIYKALYLHDRNALGPLQDSLQMIGRNARLDRNTFARMVVAFVQDIPYNYVMPESCEGYDKHPCVPNERFGIFSPVEFLYRLQGDCDTRTVLLFTLLTNFGYQPLIINSVEYGHSMLALDVASSGDYLVYRGRRYAFWETTNTGWLPGMIPPDMNNKRYWNVVLDTESL